MFVPCSLFCYNVASEAKTPVDLSYPWMPSSLALVHITKPQQFENVVVSRHIDISILPHSTF